MISFFSWLIRYFKSINQIHRITIYIILPLRFFGQIINKEYMYMFVYVNTYVNTCSRNMNTIQYRTSKVRSTIFSPFFRNMEKMLSSWEAWYDHPDRISKRQKTVWEWLSTARKLIPLLAATVKTSFASEPACFIHNMSNVTQGLRRQAVTIFAWWVHGVPFLTIYI